MQFRMQRLWYDYESRTETACELERWEDREHNHSPYYFYSISILYEKDIMQNCIYIIFFSASIGYFLLVSSGKMGEYVHAKSEVTQRFAECLDDFKLVASTLIIRFLIINMIFGWQEYLLFLHYVSTVSPNFSKHTWMVSLKAIKSWD